MGIKDYLEEQGWNVESAVFINAYQSDKIQMEENDSTFSVDFQNTNDPVLFWFDSNLGKGKIMNSEIKIRVESDRGLGTYIWDLSVLERSSGRNCKWL